MPIVGADVSGHKARPMQPRVDGDGKEYIYARAHGALTAKTPYLAYIDYDGWRTVAVFDTGYASTSAASHPQYVAFVPDEAIGSDTDGWGQCGGPDEDVYMNTTGAESVTSGNRWIWHDATVTGAGGATNTAIFCATYAIQMTTASASYHDVFLLGSAHRMFGVT